MISEAINPWIHIFAATIWVGPQVFLFMAAVPAVRSLDDAQARVRLMRILTTRFAYLAWGAMAILVVTGVANMFESRINKPDAGDMFDVNYGTILIAKIALVAATVILTAVHSFVIGPRLLRLQESVSDEEQIAPVRRASIIVSATNLVLALGILFFAAMLNTDFALE